jgi:antagonist of KipI
MMLKVIDASGLATIQDSGRTGWRRFGVPPSGPMDAFAFHVANKLACNPPDCAAIEIGLGDVVFQAMRDCIIAVTGAGYALSVYSWEFPLWSSYYVRAGWTIRLSKVDSGMWAYLAVSGGVQTQPVLGSHSTNLRGHFGGFNGRPLQAGDLVRTNPVRSLHEFSPRTFLEGARPLYSEHPTIDVIMGPQTKNFAENSMDAFFAGEYEVTTSSDRMGYRLNGPTLTLRNTSELVSEGMTFGSIQVPSSGQPIVMMADGPTTGGYSKIGAVCSADLPILAQCVPNQSRVRFQKTTVAKAQKKYRRLMNGIDDGIVQLEENDAWLA